MVREFAEKRRKKKKGLGRVGNWVYWFAWDRRDTGVGLYPGVFMRGYDEFYIMAYDMIWKRFYTWWVFCTVDVCDIMWVCGGR